MVQRATERKLNDRVLELVYLTSGQATRWPTRDEIIELLSEFVAEGDEVNELRFLTWWLETRPWACGRNDLEGLIREVADKLVSKRLAGLLH